MKKAVSKSLRKFEIRKALFAEHVTCGHASHYWKRDKEMYESTKCGSRMSLKRGMVMHQSKLSFSYWFIAMHLLTSTRKTFSAKELQRQLGHKRYEPIWQMMHKLRNAMGKRDPGYELYGEMELDDGFFSTPVPKDQKEEQLKPGRGSQKKTKVLVMIESEKMDQPKKGKKSRKVRHIRMKVIDDLKSDSIDAVVAQCISKESHITTDDSTSYVNLNKMVKEHESKVIPKNKINKE